MYGEDVEQPVMRGRGTAVGIETELIEGEMAKLVIGRLHRMCQVHHADPSKFEFVLFI